MKYVALFRGINVGGKNIVKMADLRQLLLDLGLSKVKTYIQSGNAFFETPLSEDDLLEKIRTGFSGRFGFESNVLIRTIEEIRDLIEQFPVPPEKIAEAEAAEPQIEHLYVYFLETPPERAGFNALSNEITSEDMLFAGKRELYFLCCQSIRNSKLAAGISKMASSATVRNWKTVGKLYDMMNEQI